MSRQCMKKVCTTHQTCVFEEEEKDNDTKFCQPKVNIKLNEPKFIYSFFFKNIFLIILTTMLSTSVRKYSHFQ